MTSYKTQLELATKSYAEGAKISSVQSWLKSSTHNGYDESYDGSLLVAYYHDGVIVAGVGGFSGFAAVSGGVK